MQHIKTFARTQRTKIIGGLIIGIVMLTLGVLITVSQILHTQDYKTFEDAKPLLNRLRQFQYWSIVVLGFNLLFRVYNDIFLSKESENYVKLNYLLHTLKDTSIINDSTYNLISSIKPTNLFQIGK